MSCRTCYKYSSFFCLILFRIISSSAPVKKRCKLKPYLVESPAFSHKLCKSVQCHWLWCSDSFRSAWTKQILSEITKQHEGSSFPLHVEMHCSSSRLAHSSSNSSRCWCEQMAAATWATSRWQLRFMTLTIDPGGIPFTINQYSESCKDPGGQERHTLEPPVSRKLSAGCSARSCGKKHFFISWI